MMDIKNRYGMNVPDDQIDQSIEEAKSKKRMYPFPDPETNYIRYDDKGKSYIASTHGYKFAHSDNQTYYGTKNDPNSYDGTVEHLKKVAWLSLRFQFKHVKPGNYKLFLNQCFENDKIKGTMNFKVFVGEKLVHEDGAFPNDEMVKARNLAEVYIKDIRREDFDMNKLDKNGDQEVRLEFNGNNQNAWKNGWLIDGGRLLEA